MKNLQFASVLAGRLAAYVALRRSLGYELRSQVYILRKFDRVAQREMKEPGPVTRDVVHAFLRSLDGLQPLTRRVQLSVVRPFLRYLQPFEPQTFIPGRSCEPAVSSPRAPHIYTDDEIHALLREALRYPVRYPCWHGPMYHTLIALLYATGLRISEALALTLNDLDWKRAVLQIRKTKFHKSRLVPMTRSTCAGVQRYLVDRSERGHPTTPDASVFVNREGMGLSQSTARRAFVTISRQAGVRSSTQSRPPRLHDLRHTAAVKRLLLWYREGKEVQALVPVLATYLGHSSVRSTEVYLTTIPELLSEASARFEQHFWGEEHDARGEGGAK
jgi:integrase